MPVQGRVRLPITAKRAKKPVVRGNTKNARVTLAGLVPIKHLHPTINIVNTRIIRTTNTITILMQRVEVLVVCRGWDGVGVVGEMGEEVVDMDMVEVDMVEEEDGALVVGVGGSFRWDCEVCI